METLTFSIDLSAEKPLIWHALWDENNYRKWASVFFDGSYIVVDEWNEGSKIHFLGEDGNGIFSVIERHLPNEMIQFKHIGNVLRGKEQTIDEETQKWSGAKENYSVIETENGRNRLTLQLNVMEDHLDFMKEKTPKALEVIREMCE